MFNKRVLKLNSPPIIGKNYWVPSIEAQFGIIPVLGNTHIDPEFDDVSDEHIHIDVRFIKDSEIIKYFTNQGITEKDLYNEIKGIGIIPTIKVIGKPRIKERKMVCVRDIYIWQRNEIAKVLEKIHQDSKLNLKCKVCPHRGFDLKSMPIINGIIHCPGHGLGTGKLIRKTKYEEI